MAETSLVLDAVFEAHDTGPGHPERPERIAALRRAFEAGGTAERCRRIRPEPVSLEDLQRVHPRSYIEHVEAACRRGETLLDSMDTAIGPRSYEIARLAAGSLIALCRDIASGNTRRGFAAVRPPGHHAERATAMGFCLFNNVAVAARWLQANAGVERVLIVDWDVHHGNGTQHIFEEEPTVFYFSVHQFPLYPGTGRADERGRGAGEGFTRNCPLPPGAGDEAFLGALRDVLARDADEFRPQWVLVSAGFDAHARDPLAQLQVSTEAFGEATRIVQGIADAHARGRLASVLEGGYDLEALAASASLHLNTLLEDGA